MRKVPLTQDVVGTKTTPVTLTVNFTDNKKQWKISRQDDLEFFLKYIPAVDNAYLEMQIEVANTNDVPTTTDWYLYSGILYGSTEDDVFSPPFFIPGSKTTTHSTTYNVALFPDDLSGLWIRVSFKEITTGAFGTLYASSLAYEDQ